MSLTTNRRTSNPPCPNCGAELGDVNGEKFIRVNTETVKCASCQEKVHKYVRKTVTYGVEWIMAQEVSQGALIQGLEAIGLHDIRLERVGDDITVKEVGEVQYTARGNWKADMRGKIAAVIQRMGSPITSRNVIAEVSKNEPDWSS